MLHTNFAPLLGDRGFPHATTQGGTGLSGRPYVIKIGTAHAVVDPNYHWGPDPGWWLIVTADRDDGLEVQEAIPHDHTLP